jgi:hypothetical protein
MWARSFLAMRVLSGGHADDALAEMPEAERALAASLASGLTDVSRAVRARALADALGEVARHLDEVTLR